MPKGRLRRKDEETIRRLYTYLSSNLDAKDIIVCCFEKGLGDESDKEEIFALPTKQRRTEHFIDHVLLRGGETGFDIFLAALRQEDPDPSILKTLEEPWHWADLIKSERKNGVICAEDAKCFSNCIEDGWKSLLTKLKIDQRIIDERIKHYKNDISDLILKWAEEDSNNRTVEHLLDIILQSEDLKIETDWFRLYENIKK